MTEIQKSLKDFGVVPVIVIEDPKDAKPLCQALIDGGLPVAEITLRTDCALEAITKASEVDGMLVGAGTVLNATHAKQTIEAGAQFLVSPGLDKDSVCVAQKSAIPLIPGTTTATEIQMAWNYGLRMVKFFPAELSGGAKAVKGLSAVFRDMQFFPTGGISEANLADYYSCPAVQVCGGSWIAPEKLIAAGDFGKIEKRAKDAVTLVQKTREALS